VEFLPVSQSSYTDGPWTQCAHDVKRGLVDMCVGNFWETTERRAVSQFSTAIMTESFYLLVPLPKEEKFTADTPLKLFSPFTASLWLTIVGVTFIVGITSEFLGSGVRSRTNFGVQAIRSVYRSSMQMLRGTDSPKTKSFANKPLEIAWAFFILIVVSTYTANLAAFLSQKREIYNISSINECLAKNCLICFTTSYTLESLTKELYPDLHYNNSYPKDNILLLNDLREGKCDAVMISKYQWNTYRSFLRKCDVTFIGNFVLQFKVAVPVSDTISKAITYWIGKSNDENGIANILKKYQPDQECHNSVAYDEIIETEQITVWMMTGPLLMLVLSAIVGFLIKILLRKNCFVEEEKGSDHGTSENGIFYNRASDTWECPNKVLSYRQCLKEGDSNVEDPNVEDSNVVVSQFLGNNLTIKNK